MLKVVIVGVGAIGSPVVLNLRNLPHPLTVVDFDRVEQKNTLAQLHGRTSLGRNKAISIQQMMMGLFGRKVEALPVKLTQDNAEVLLKNSALVIDCTDNIEARRLIAATAKGLSIPVLHGTLSADGTFSRCVWDEHFTPDAEDTAGQATCEDGEQLPFFSMAGARIAHEAKLFLQKGTKRSFMIGDQFTTRLA